WREIEQEVTETTLTSQDDTISWSWLPPEGGSYKLAASIADRAGHRNESERYQPDEVAEILLQAPFYPAEGLLTLRRAGIVSTEPFKVTKASYLLKIPLTEAHIPNLHVQVDLVGAAPRVDQDGTVDPTLPPRPAFATGTLNLKLPPL